MSKSNPVDETRIADPVEPANPQSRANVKKASRTAKAQKRRARSKGASGSRKGTKKLVIAVGLMGPSTFPSTTTRSAATVPLT